MYRKPAMRAPNHSPGREGGRLSSQSASARFVAVVGHEIRTPLAAALMHMYIAENNLFAGVPSQAARDALATARDEILRVERLVGRVIELEQTGRAVIRPARVDAVDVVRRTIARAMCGATGAGVILEQAPATLVGCWDGVALEQILQNLLSNALKFGCNRPVSVTVGSVGSALRLTVRDQGVGIKLADHQRIFRRSVRAPAQSAGGLGLGLWLVRELCTAHGGVVTLRSSPGKGATFIVTLPEGREPAVSAPALKAVNAPRAAGSSL